MGDPLWPRISMNFANDFAITADTVKVSEGSSQTRGASRTRDLTRSLPVHPFNLSKPRRSVHTVTD